MAFLSLGGVRTFAVTTTPLQALTENDARHGLLITNGSASGTLLVAFAGAKGLYATTYMPIPPGGTLNLSQNPPADAVWLMGSQAVTALLLQW